jgi:manganese/zinc/iron transport system ATP- binding protein
MKNAIELDHVFVSYYHSIALEDVNLKLPLGVLGAIIGPNGSGKSTLIKSILGLVKPSFGSIKVLGAPYKGKDNNITYMPQKASVDWDFPISVLEVVLMGAYSRSSWLKKIKTEEQDKAQYFIKKLGLEQHQNKQISELSGGQQQRVFFARALLQDSPIFLMDEPFQGIDIDTEHKIIDIFKELQKEGKTIYCVHHDLNSVQNYFNHVTFINKKVLYTGPTSEVYTKENIEASFRTNL